MNNERFKKNWQELRSCEGIEQLTKPSDDCLFNKCNGDGWISYKNWDKYWEMIDNPHIKFKAEEIEWHEKCECVDARKQRNELRRKISAAGIPEKFIDAKVHDFQIDIYKDAFDRKLAELAKKAAINFVENYSNFEQVGKGIYLTSKVKGSGKTRLASSIANALMKRHQKNVLFIKATDISPQVRKTYNNKADTTEEEVLRVFREVEVLVIDDCAVNDSTGYSEDLLGKILDHRMDQQLVTLVTSNQTIKELKTHYKKGIVHSRIEKLCYQVEMPEESIREKESEQEGLEIEKLLFGEK